MIQPTSAVHFASVCIVYELIGVWINECMYQETLPPGSVNQSITTVSVVKQALIQCTVCVVLVNNKK
jgi:hypothetical protein